MEEKLVKRKEKALKNVSNKRMFAEACNDLAIYYHKHKRYRDAINEFELQAKVCEELGLRMRWAACNRMIGEMYLAMSEFDKALMYVEWHLSVAKEHKNCIEELKAMETLGRIHLLKGQSTSNEEARTSLIAAEEAFMKSLALCRNFHDKISQRKLMDIHARLLLNMGDVQEHLGHFDRAIECIRKAINICANENLCEVLHNCHTTEAYLHSNKKDYTKALSCLNEALEVASRLKDMVLKTCETLAFKADILCKMSEYQNAKQLLLKAWKMKTPDEKDRENIESNLKIVVAMCETRDLLLSSDPSDHLTLKNLYEKLGDGACRLNNYAGAVEYYSKMLAQAEMAGDRGKTLAPIYVSLYQTYKDMKCYDEALDYCKKEYELIKDVPKEAFTTLYNIAEVLFLAKQPYHQVEKACLDARNAAKKCKKNKYEIRVLKRFLKYQTKYGDGDTVKMVGIKADLRALGYADFDNLESSEDESSVGGGDGDTTHIGDDVCLEDLAVILDVSNTNEECVPEITRVTRRPEKRFIIKKNPKGETQLHSACISGNKLLVERLLANGHPVNVRDNAGWLPLHEACIHGRREVASLLIDSGANVNDMGGLNCSGRTPLYDAATYGHLEVMELLLEKGAIPSLKTDFGETPLLALQKWRTGRVLTEDKEILYKYICNTINCFNDHIDGVDRISKLKTPIKPTNDISLPSTSKMSSSIQKYNSPMRENIVYEDSIDYDEIMALENNENQTSDDTETSDDLSQFPEVELNTSKHTSDSNDEDDCFDDNMGANKRNNKRKLSDPTTVVAKRPLLENHKDSVQNANSRGSDDVDASENRSESQNHLIFCPKIVSTKSLANTNVCSEVISEKSMADSNTKYKFRDTMRLRYKRQRMLLDAEFQKTDDDSSSSNSGNEEISRKDNRQPTPTKKSLRHSSSDNTNKDFNMGQNNSGNEENSRKDKRQTPIRKSLGHSSSDNTNKNLNMGQNNSENEENSGKDHRQPTPSKKSSRHSSSDNTNKDSNMGQNNSGSEENSRKDKRQTPRNSLGHSSLENNTNNGLNVVQNKNCSTMQLSNENQPLDTVQPENGPSVQTQILPPAAVKVHIEDKVLLISLKLDTMNKLTISWLVEEVKSRYYKLTGVRPVFSLMTSDGAILSEDDPLSLVLSSPELKTCVTNWKASAAEERFLNGMHNGITEKEGEELSRSPQHTSHPEAVSPERPVSSTRNSPGQVTPRPSQSIPGPSSSTDSTDEIPSNSVPHNEPELDDDILQLFGDAPKSESPLGPPIHEYVASKWQGILKEGLQNAAKNQILNLYSVPNNCALLLAPTLNPEVKSAVRDVIVEHDSWLMHQQKQIGVAISALGTVVNSILANETSKQKILKPIGDACRLLCDIHFNDTEIRRNFIIGSISTDLKDSLVDTVRENQLFGDNLNEKIKSTKPGEALQTDPECDKNNLTNN